MRCVIAYYMDARQRSRGSIEFGVSGEDDPRVEQEKARLSEKGYEVYAVRFW